MNPRRVAERMRVRREVAYAALETPLARAVTLFGLNPGVNVDAVHYGAGMARLEQLGWDPRDDWMTHAVVLYALQRWARGEEHAAERGVIDRHFHGIDLTSWRVVLAAAVAAGEERLRGQGADDPGAAADAALVEEEVG